MKTKVLKNDFLDDLSSEHNFPFVEKCDDILIEYRRRVIRKNQPKNTKWTYIMYDGESEMCKIGISNNPYRRERQMKSFRPKAGIFLLHVDNKEKELHERYADKHYAGEWFKLTESDLNELLDEGFRFPPNSFHDDFDHNELYVVPSKELRRNFRKEKYCHQESYDDLLDLYNELGGEHYVTKKKLVEIANERGLRTPSGFPWTYGFVIHVFRLYRDYIEAITDK